MCDAQSTMGRRKDMNNYRSNWLAFTMLVVLATVIIGAMVITLPGTLNARDPGINQPGAAGNIGPDPGINQPGAAGNIGRDPGINQPGAAGNVGARSWHQPAGCGREHRTGSWHQPAGCGREYRTRSRHQPAGCGRKQERWPPLMRRCLTVRPCLCRRGGWSGVTVVRGGSIL